MAIHPKMPLLLYSGEVKEVRDLKVGDQLMGRDSEPRTITKLVWHWNADAYHILPKQGRGNEIICSHHQILTLTKASFLDKPYRKWKNGKAILKKRYPSWNHLVHVFAKDIADKTYDGFWKKFKLTKTPVDFKSRQIACSHVEGKLPPYFIGLWLGDGTSTRPEITTMDTEIVEWLYQLAPLWDTKIHVQRKVNNRSSTYALTIKDWALSKGKNRILEALRHNDLIGNKHIPDCYLFASMQDRLALLAGLLDTDGHLQRNCFTISQKNKRLAEQIRFLANMLGFRATLKKIKKGIKKRSFKGKYVEVSISGALDEIPTLLPRKKGLAGCPRYDRKQIGYDIIKLPPIDLIEIVSDGDGMFLLEDCCLIGGRAELTRNPLTRNEEELDKRWGRNFGMIKAYVRRNRRLPVPSNTLPHERWMYNWINNQRADLVNSRSTTKRIFLLNGIGITPHKLAQCFERNFSLLRDYRDINPNKWPRYREAYPLGNPLGEWCRTLRKAYKKGRLNEERIERLTSIGFLWKIRK